MPTIGAAVLLGAGAAGAGYWYFCHRPGGTGIPHICPPVPPALEVHSVSFQVSHTDVYLGTEFWVEGEVRGSLDEPLGNRRVALMLTGGPWTEPEFLGQGLTNVQGKYFLHFPSGLNTVGTFTLWVECEGVLSDSMTVVVSPLAPPPPPVMYGDVDMDGVVTSADANLVARYDAGLVELTPEQLRRADVAPPYGVVNIVDAVTIQRYVDGLIDKFPVEG